MILTSTVKNVYVLINVTVFTNFGTKTFYKFHDLFPNRRPESRFDLAIKMTRSAKGHHRKILGHKSSKLSMKSYVLAFPHI